MKPMWRGLLLPGLFVMAACSSPPCPSGQEFIEERHSATEIKARGCVGPDAQGNYRRQGQWEFFYENGHPQAIGAYRDAFMGGATPTPPDPNMFSDVESPDWAAVDVGILADGREGVWKFWYEDGQKASEITYSRGHRNGPWFAWHRNGQKGLDAMYRDGNFVGTLRGWHANGQREWEVTFDDGGMNGHSTRWYPNGQKRSEESFSDGLVKNGREWYASGKKKAEKNLGPDTPQLVVEWYESGQKESESFVRDGVRLSTEWYENGQKRSETTFRLGRGFEFMREWYANGNRKSEATLNGMVTESSRQWDEEGNPIPQSGRR